MLRSSQRIRSVFQSVYNNNQYFKGRHLKYVSKICGQNSEIVAVLLLTMYQIFLT